jgi:hypothetical protein
LPTKVQWNGLAKFWPRTTRGTLMSSEPLDRQILGDNLDRTMTMGTVGNKVEGNEGEHGGKEAARDGEHRRGSTGRPRLKRGGRPRGRGPGWGAWIGQGMTRPGLGYGGWAGLVYIYCGLGVGGTASLAPFALLDKVKI